MAGELASGVHAAAGAAYAPARDGSGDMFASAIALRAIACVRRPLSTSATGVALLVALAPWCGAGGGVSGSYKG